MTETRRRGRPPGSRNRAKPTAAQTRLVDLQIGQSKTTGPDWTPEIGRAPVPMDQAGYVSPSEPTITVILSVRRAFGDEATEQGIEWPASWRLPQQGEAVHVRSDWGGIVQSLDFDLERGLIVCHLR